MVLTRRQALDRFLLRVVDGSLAGVIFLVPLLMGGRHAIGQLALTALAVTAAWAWAARLCLRDDAAWRPTWAVPLILAGLALVGLQAVPLPPSALAWLTPHMNELLPLWNAQGTTPATLGGWPCVSLTPSETLAGLVLFLDFALLFLVSVQRITHIEDVERLLRWCALSAVCMAIFGIVQLLTNNGKFFWFYEHPFSKTSDAAKGSFTNRNHFAHFLALGIGPLVWWLQDASRRMRVRAGVAARSAAVDWRREELKTYLLGLALGIVLFAGLLSLSRGGILVIFLALGVCTAVCYQTSSVSGRFVAALGSVGLLIGLSLAIFGFDRVSNRLEDLSSGSLERLDRDAGRRTIWAAAAKALPNHLLLGTGVGSFREVYPMYTDALPDEGLEYTHAEDCYLQDAVETGMIGFGLTLAGIGLCVFWCVCGVRTSNPTRLRLCAGAICASLAASAAHALVDFVWYVPACMAMVALLVACALRVQQLSRGAKTERTPAARRWALAPAWCVVAVVVLTLVGGWMVTSRVGPALAQPYWEEYQIGRHAAEVQAQTASTTVLSDVETLREWIVCLDNAVRWQPSHPRAHLALAETHRRLFDQLQSDAPNQMSLANIRDAAIRSRFESREALTVWLSRAVGKHWAHLGQSLCHTRRAIALTPLQGRGYVYLADLAFLSGADTAVRRACVQQALCVRPHDGSVLYAAGTEALLAGDAAQWLQYCKRAFRSGRRMQEQLMGDLVASTPAEDLPTVIDFILREFQPDLAGLRYLHTVCAKRCGPDQLAGLTRCWAERAQRDAPKLAGPQAVRIWLEAERLYSQLGDQPEALACARGAVACDPNSHDAHYRLALLLLNERFFADAESHLRWCLQRTPGDQFIEAKLRESLKGRLDNQRRADAGREHLR